VSRWRFDGVVTGISASEACAFLPPASWQTRALDFWKADAHQSVPFATTLRDGKAKSKPVHVLNSWLAPSFVYEAPAGISTLAELGQAAQARANQLFGSPVDRSWMVSSNWRAQDPMLCHAVPKRWMDALDGHVTTPLMLLLDAAQDAIPQTAWVAVSTPHESHVLHRRSGHWIHLRTARLARSTSLDEPMLLAQVEREKQLTSLAGPVVGLHVGTGPKQWNVIARLNTSFERSANGALESLMSGSRLAASEASFQAALFVSLSRELAR
jgi:hypothetical protein